MKIRRRSHPDRWFPLAERLKWAASSRGPWVRKLYGTMLVLACMATFTGVIAYAAGSTTGLALSGIVLSLILAALVLFLVASQLRMLLPVEYKPGYRFPDDELDAWGSLGRKLPALLYFTVQDNDLVPYVEQDSARMDRLLGRGTPPPPNCIALHLATCCIDLPLTDFTGEPGWEAYTVKVSLKAHPRELSLAKEFALAYYQPTLTHERWDRREEKALRDSMAVLNREKVVRQEELLYSELMSQLMRTIDGQLAQTPTMRPDQLKIKGELLCQLVKHWAPVDTVVAEVQCNIA